jgi:beta-N-acetylhexosaminidase
MTGHLVVTAYDDQLPATLSPRILTGLLRNEVGFDGPVITDGIEMAAVSGAYGLGGASARAIAAGADAICVGGENSGEDTVDGIRDAIVDAVTEGRMPEERLGAAAARMRRLARWSAPASAGGPAGPDHAPIGLLAARRAIRVTRPGAALPLRVAPHVIELSPRMNLAIDKHTPWGVGEPLGKLLPGTTVSRVNQDVDAAGVLDPVLAPASGRPLVIVVRDAHRHPWQMDALDHLLAARPDAIVVEMGLPGRTDLGAVHIATHGSARVCGQAAAEVLTGLLDGSP